MFIQFLPPKLFKYFPCGLALMVFMIYCMFGFLIYHLESEKNWCDNLFLFNGTFCILTLYWCLYRTARGDPGFAELSNINPDEEKDETKRFCLVCKMYKPERSHHCSKCKRCVLNMDHHCVWTANCIGLNNRKSFNLILFWGALGMMNASLLGVFNAEIIYNDLQLSYTNEFKFSTMRCLMTLLMILTQFFNGSGLLYFFIRNMLYLLKNSTTLDDLKEQRKGNYQNLNLIEENPYDLGVWYNFTFYFGKNPLLWFFPVGKPSGDGYNWDKKQPLVQIVTF